MQSQKTCLLLFSILLFGSFCFGQTIKIRVLNTGNGHPLPDKKVSISMGYEEGERTPTQYQSSTTMVTDDEGKVQITLPTPTPSFLSFLIDLGSEWWIYEPQFTLKTTEVLRKGVVRKMGFDVKGDIVPNAVPLEIVILTRQFVSP